MEVKKINKVDVKPKQDPCGSLRELYNSENLSIAHDIVLGTARKHKHEKMEEVYYVEKGEGKLHIEDKTLELKLGDIISIPKNSPHYLEKIPDKEFEILVITYPRYDPNDMIFVD